MIIKRMFNLINSVKKYNNQMKKYTMQVLVVTILFILETMFAETIVILFHEIITNASLQT